jgi:hypothetical protein
MNPFKAANRAFDFPTFFNLVEQFVSNESTTGELTEEHIEFTKLNLQRMKRWNKTYVVTEEMNQILAHVPKQTWWLITEAWCGDSAQITVPLAKIAEASQGNIEMKLILRDENPAIIEKYLTNGGKAVPKLVVFDELDNELFQWGPRPQYLVQMVNDWKANQNGKTFDEVKKEMHLWYAKDKGVQLTVEIATLLQKTTCLVN